MVPIKSSRKRAAILVILLCLILTVCIHNQWGYRGNCVLCNARPYHEPCVISLATGDVIPLTVYDSDPFLVGELAEEQTDGYSSLYHYTGFAGYRDTNSRKTIGRIHASSAEPFWRVFCYSCRKELSAYSEIGFALADLKNPKEKNLHPLESGSTLTFRCYEIKIVSETGSNIFNISVQGTLS